MRVFFNDNQYFVWQPSYNFRSPKGDFEKHCAWSTKMAGKLEEESCSSCFKNTKYNCLWCQEYYCIPCSVFENDETVKGWRVGSSVPLLWAMYLRSYPWTSTKRWNIRIKMKLAKIEIYRSKKTQAFLFLHTWNPHKVCHLYQLQRQCRSKVGPY